MENRVTVEKHLIYHLSLLWKCNFLQTHTHELNNWLNNFRCLPLQLDISRPVTHFLCIAMTTLSELQATSVVIRCVCGCLYVREKERDRKKIESVCYLAACNTYTNVLPKAAIKPCHLFIAINKILCTISLCVCVPKCIQSLLNPTELLQCSK